MISHYMLEYGYVPLWVLVNALSLGTIGIFYSYLKQKDQNDIGRQFLTIYRNACAHDERLYNLKSLRNNMKPNSIRTLSLHGKLGIPVNSSNNPIYGKNDLFAIIIIFKTMLPKKSFDTFFMALKKLDEQGNRVDSPEWADCSGFYQGYALVLEKNGMAYLVDRDFNKVTEGYPADSVSQAGGMFCVAKGDEQTFLYMGLQETPEGD